MRKVKTILSLGCFRWFGSARWLTYHKLRTPFSLSLILLNFTWSFLNEIFDWNPDKNHQDYWRHKNNFYVRRISKKNRFISSGERNISTWMQRWAKCIEQNWIFITESNSVFLLFERNIWNATFNIKQIKIATTLRLMKHQVITRMTKWQYDVLHILEQEISWKVGRSFSTRCFHLVENT